MAARGLNGPGDPRRKVAESTDETEAYRSAYRRDYARLIHSPAFRRLQGKTQLFPGFESDFFRNRLTHSLEVGQIAKSIALRLNAEVADLKSDPINVDIVELAGLAHDLGHPPFGHNGEAALDECMKQYGGFEGNAQTFRIVARLEKKRLEPGADADAKYVGVDATGKDYRAGLNWCARSLASVLKYDQEIPVVRDPGSPLVKGYYHSDAETVTWVRECVLPTGLSRPLKTIECQIMDLADDIAYSTYDLEDNFKAGFLTPLSLVSLEKPFLEKIAKDVGTVAGKQIGVDDVLATVMKIFEFFAAAKLDPIVAYRTSLTTAENGYTRTEVTGDLVSTAVSAVSMSYDKDCPALSTVALNSEVERRVKVLKRINYNAVILSPKLKVSEYRGKEIVTTIFKALVEDDGYLLLPADYQELYNRCKPDTVARHRVVCDFIAGMTDAYAIEFYARLKSENARTIFKPF